MMVSQVMIPIMEKVETAEFAAAQYGPHLTDQASSSLSYLRPQSGMAQRFASSATGRSAPYRAADAASRPWRYQPALTRIFQPRGEGV
jgi:hypothetical protein